MIELRNYQKHAIESLTQKIENIIRSPENGVAIFQAPTGSGKTVMVSQILKELVKNREDEKTFSFIWVSVRMLHEQSKDKLEKYYEDDRILECSYFEELNDRRIDENEILFLNWSSINKKNINVFIKENEMDNNLNAVISNTKEEGREIILVIDESHHTASSSKSRELIDIISPKVTIEVSATPHLKDNVSEIEKVYLADVKSEEMIKSEISVNPEFLTLKINQESSDEVVIDQALNKRKELKKYFEDNGSNINPLILIQLPNKKSDLISKKDDVLRILKQKGITVENGKLAIWLSKKKTDTLINVEKNDNEVEVLIFKQAIALGWDCPRASILIIFRETKSFVFTIQTIGRIMRMPELKYYDETELNKGFVFTNLSNITITEDYAKDYVTIYESKRNDGVYASISLPSIHLRRQRERTRLSGKFLQTFLNNAKKIGLSKKITPTPSKIVSPIIADGIIVNIDQMGEIEHEGTIDIKLNSVELQQRFDKFIIDNCSPYAPRDSSDRMKTALYQFILKEFGIKKYDPKAQEIVLGKENVQAFVDAINLSKEDYKLQIVKQISETREKREFPNWEIPHIISFNSKCKKQEKNKSIMKPFYFTKTSKPEELFIDALEKSNNVNWWFKNGENESKFFAVPYSENSLERAFYVDFIVKFNDGKIGLFDTKAGITAKTAKDRAEGLQKFIQSQVTLGRNIWGGIAIFVNGSWRYNEEEDYQYNPNDLSSWKILNL